jgi:hypothetical protein
VAEAPFSFGAAPGRLPKDFVTVDYGSDFNGACGEILELPTTWFEEKIGYFYVF